MLSKNKVLGYSKFLESIKSKVVKIHIPVPDDIKKISDAYANAGKDIYVVGGAIRDFLQGKTPHDYDLVTNALPEESKVILKGFNVSDEQGKNFGVLRIYTKDEPLGYEIASYRKDISGGRDTKGDGEKVEMGSHITIEDDSQRRDLSINSLYYDIHREEIIDLVGGIDDIKNSVIRAVGNPSERFVEDRLRIIRTFRFASRTGGIIDKATSDAIKSDSRLKGISDTDDVSQERIYEEIKKAWEQAKDFNYFLGFFTKFDMWDQIFQGSNINTNLVDSKDFVVVMANLFKNEDTDRLESKLVQSYKIDSDLSKKIVFLLNLLKFDANNIIEIYKKKIQCSIEDKTILEWLDVNSIHDNNIIKFVDYKPSVSATELMNQGLKGKELGEKIKELEIKKYNEL